MRVVAVILVLLTLFVGVYFGYCYIGISMQIESVTAEWTNAEDAVDLYRHTLRQLEEGSFAGKRFDSSAIPGPEELAFLTLTVRMDNRGLLSQDWIEIHVTPKEGDVALLSQERTPTLAANTRADFSVTLLTKAGADEKHDIRVTYYVLGKQYEVRFSM